MPQSSQEATANAASHAHARPLFMPKAGTGKTSAAPVVRVAPSAMPVHAGHPLALWLNWLDARLRGAMGVMRTEIGAEAAGDAYRGLYVTPADIDRLLAQPAGYPLFAGLGEQRIPSAPLPLQFKRLAEAAGLTDFDIAVLLMAAAPELDLRYERLYAFLQDDVSRKLPSIDLALNLLCADIGKKLQMRSRFKPAAPLVKYGLLKLLPETGRTASPFIAQTLKPDTQVLAALLGEPGLGEDLQVCAHLHEAASADAAPPDAPLEQLIGIARLAVAGGETLRCYLHGPDQLGLQAAADALADGCARAMLHLDLVALKRLARVRPAPNTIFSDALGAAFRHAWMHGTSLCFDGIDALHDGGSDAELHELLAHLDRPIPVCLLTGAAPQGFAGNAGRNMLSLALPAFACAQRQQSWRAQLEQHGLDTGAAAMLAARFRLGAGQIGEAVQLSAGRTRLEPAAGMPGAALEQTLFAAARQQTRHAFVGLAQRIEPARGWDDLVLPEDALAQLHEILSRFFHQEQVLQEWGFAAKLGHGTGTAVLFAGPSGTGKTMAAEVLAKALGQDLYRIDLAAVVSKYIGETEKNLDRLFAAADQANAVLFFDEADALFGKRTEVKDAHDRYANLETSYLLQKMEQFQGIAILASNLRQNLDEAFVRRLAFIVHFPFPDEAQRKRIWQAVWPAGVRLDGDLSLDDLARELKLSGGNIKNVALAAAFLAAGENGTVGREHIRRAAEREFQKLGRPNPTHKAERAT